MLLEVVHLKTGKYNLKQMATGSLNTKSYCLFHNSFRDTLKKNAFGCQTLRGSFVIYCVQEIIVIKTNPADVNVMCFHSTKLKFTRDKVIKL